MPKLSLDSAELDMLRRLADWESPAMIAASSGDVMAVWRAIMNAQRLLERQGPGRFEPGVVDAVRRWHAQLRSVTLREMEVIGLVASGYSNGEIGRELVISRRTVHQHLVNVTAKLGISNRTQLAVMAVMWGWVDGATCVERILERRRAPAGYEW